MIELKNDAEGVRAAIDILSNGGVGIFPTDTVYGIGCLPQKSVLDRFYEIKNRSTEKPTAVLISSRDQLDSLIDPFSLKTKRIVEKFWPGDLTLVLPSSLKIEKRLAPEGFVGIRWPKYRMLENIIKHTGPLVVSSANFTGGNTPANSSEIEEDLRRKVDFVLIDKAVKISLPSTVAHIDGGRITILRQGRITLENLETV